MSSPLNRLNRRDVLRAAVGSLFVSPATSLLAATPAGQDVSHSPLFPAPATPEAAVRLLQEGNERYLAEKFLMFQHSPAELRRASWEHQSPFAAILTCSDSRVPPEIIFDQSLGCLFVVRVAGNIAAPDTLASLEYAAAELGVKTILVMGHTECGAVKATIALKPVPGQISSLFQYIRPAVETSHDVNEVSRRNAILQAKTLRESSPVLDDMVQQRKVSVRASLYDVVSGRVRLLD